VNLDDLTLGQLKQLHAFAMPQPAVDIANALLGHSVLVRTNTAGVWAGVLTKKTGSEVILSRARRLCKWKTKIGISLSAVALHGVDGSGSLISEAVSNVWLQAIEIIQLTKAAEESIFEQPNAEAR
jgi:hypothetical protein